jgi:hypothetical protein
MEPDRNKLILFRCGRSRHATLQQRITSAEQLNSGYKKVGKEMIKIQRNNLELSLDIGMPIRYITSGAIP